MVKEAIGCGYCDATFTGVGSTPQAAKDHATLLRATHWKNNCLRAPKNLKNSISATIRLAPIPTSI